MLRSEDYRQGLRTLKIQPLFDKEPFYKKYKSSFFECDQGTILIGSDTDVYDVDGTLLFKFRKSVLSEIAISTFVMNFEKHFNVTSAFRGMSAGEPNKIVKSGIAGYFDTSAVSTRIKCKKKGLDYRDFPIRQCRFNDKNPTKFEGAKELLQEIDDGYKRYAPDKWGYVKDRAEKSPFTLFDTCFSTFTTNKNFQTALHTDSGDYGDYACLTAFGDFTGSYFMLPRYNICIDLQQGDLLIANVHEPHCNTEKTSGDRVSMVCYLREGLLDKWNYLLEKNEDETKNSYFERLRAL